MTHLNSKTNQRGLRRWWASGIAAVSLFGVSLPPATAANSTVETGELSSSSGTTEVALIDLFDLIQGTVQYIQVSNISNEEEVAIGRRINRMLLERNYELYQNQQVNRYVEQLGNRLVAASDRRDIPYQFQVVASDEINAFAVPGGYIYVTTGLIEAADNEAQLASVIAHEIAHVNERHSVRALQQAVLARGVATTLGLEANTLANIGYQLALELPRSRDYEYEADLVGLEILQNAGYAPIGFINFFQKLASQSSPPEFLSTHPTSENRIEAIAAQLETQNLRAGRGLNESAYRQKISPVL